jgi:hypothetical protein
LRRWTKAGWVRLPPEQVDGQLVAAFHRAGRRQLS